MLVSQGDASDNKSAREVAAGPSEDADGPAAESSQPSLHASGRTSLSGSPGNSQPRGSTGALLNDAAQRIVQSAAHYRKDKKAVR